MTTILFIFLLAFLLTMITTPVVKKLGLHYGLVDIPSARKIHKVPVPRIGGVAIFIAFLLPFGLLFLFRSQSGIAQLFFNDTRITGFILGAILVFLLGLLDDIKSLSSGTKFAGQILVALVAYYSDFRITVISIPFSDSLSLGIFSLPVTIFWFVLVINAINLVDGLDGLAAGICLFVSLTMLFICISSNHYVVALGFAALAGTLLGFLRYNFNPASIFMGDSGSYFLGYAVAALSIAGSVKGQVATAMLIPVIALGVPLIDTLWAPVRRFIIGQKMFRPDSNHFHHRLVRMGYTQRRAVLFLYILTIVFGFGSIAIVHTQDDTAALILVVLGAGVIFLTHYLGVSSFFTMNRMFSWARDVTDEAGISHDRRIFLNHQLEISKAQGLDTLWKAICQSLALLEFDCAEFTYFMEPSSSCTEVESRNFSWQRYDHFNPQLLTEACLLKIELPLHCHKELNCRNFGSLLLIKDMRKEVASHYTLKRVEHLRRTMVSTLLKINLQ